MEYYVFKSVACLTILFVFYKLFLERANMHTFKRYFLLVAIIAAVVIPFITFTSYVEIPLVETDSVTAGESATITSVYVEQAPNYLAMILWFIYGLGVLFFSIKFVRNLYQLITKIKRNPKFRNQNVIHVLLNRTTTPHTFFLYIFVNKDKFEAREIPEEVLLHERTHALEKHSLDILFVELCQIVFWFNPLIYLIKDSIKLNHEFLADRAVLQNGGETSTYQNMLLEFSSNGPAPVLTNSIHFSSLKKRFTAMKAQTSKRSFWLRSLLILPLLAILIYSFSSTQEIVVPKEDTAISEKRKATPKEVREYNKLAKKYNEMDQENMWIDGKEITRLRYIYDIMTINQRKKAEPYPSFPPPPPLPEAELPPPPPLPDGPNEFVAADSPPPPPPPPAPEGTNNFVEQDPPPPPPAPPADPKEHIKKMEAQGATFYYNDKEVSYNAVIDLVLFNENLNIQTTTYNSSPPIVHISRDFVVDRTNNSAKNDGAKRIPVGPKTAPETPASVLKKMIPLDAQFYFNKKKITHEEAKALVKKNKGLMVEVVEYQDKKPEVFFLDGC